MILFYDTETTGKYNFNLKPDHPSQPHLVQYAGLLVDPDTQRLVQALVSIVNPGVPIPAEAAAIHGITTEMAQRFGTSPQVVMEWHVGALGQANLVVAHNIDFDRHIMETLACRENVKVPEGVQEFCTMKAGTALCKLRGPYGFKWPKLEELHHHLFQEGFNAHDALADVQACARCYFAMTEPKEDKVEWGPTLPEKCPLCGAGWCSRDKETKQARTFGCGCILNNDGTVKIPCQAGVPKA